MDRRARAHRHRQPARCGELEWSRLPIDQTNNSYIIPGIGLGILSVAAQRVTDCMFMAAAKSFAELSPARSSKSGRLLPPVSELRSVSFAVAKAVAIQAIKDGVAGDLDEQALESRICGNVWEPVYLPYRSRPARNLRDSESESRIKSN